MLPMLPLVAMCFFSSVQTVKAAETTELKCDKGYVNVNNTDLYILSASCDTDCNAWLAKPIDRTTIIAAGLIGQGGVTFSEGGGEPIPMTDGNVPSDTSCRNKSCCFHAIKAKPPAAGTAAGSAPPAPPGGVVPKATGQVMSEKPLAMAVADPSQLVVPNLGVDIPGLTFSTVATRTACDGSQCIVIPFLAQYVNAFYTFLAGLGMVAASVMFVWGGFMYMVGATGIQIKDAKKYMIDALIGLVILLGCYVILANVNPATLNMGAVKVPDVKKDAYVIKVGSKQYKIGEQDKIPKCEKTPFTSECSDFATAGQSSASLFKFKCVDKIEDCTDMPGPGQWVDPRAMGGKPCKSSGPQFCCKIPTCNAP